MRLQFQAHQSLLDSRSHGACLHWGPAATRGTILCLSLAAAWRAWPPLGLAALALEPDSPFFSDLPSLPQMKRSFKSFFRRKSRKQPPVQEVKEGDGLGRLQLEAVHKVRRKKGLQNGLVEGVASGILFYIWHLYTHTPLLQESLDFSQRACGWSQPITDLGQRQLVRRGWDAGCSRAHSLHPPFCCSFSSTSLTSSP